MSETIDITLLNGVADVAAHEWDVCAAPECADGGRPCDPFTTHRFLTALEHSGSVGPGTGWQSRPLVAKLGETTLGFAPLYAKSDSQGEYIFDFNWAHAYELAGGHYYPKLQIAVPFTPATGRRLLCRPGVEDTARTALLQGAVQIADGNALSSLHATFCTEEEARLGAQMGLLHRVTQQFHWHDAGYGDFEGFLAGLASRKRKAIRKERRQAQDFGGTIHRLTGDDLRPEHWDAFWRFYQDTGSRKWGRPYLTRAFFEQMQEQMRDDILLVMARRDGHWVAGALNFIGRDTLFGRYWGCIEDHPCLHFELCYYQAIEFALEAGCGRVEAGAQGEHKLARGYVPSAVHSLHWIRDPGFRNAIARYLEAERDATDEEMAALSAFTPFRKGAGTAADGAGCDPADGA